MNIIVGNPVEVNGTCLQGEITISYEQLLKVFGEETSNGDGYKVDAEWAGIIDGHVFTIYNWKDGKNYNGSEGMEIEDITDWHIGGKSKEVVALLTTYITNKLKG